MLKAWAEVWFILAEGRRTLGFLRIYRPRRRRVSPPWCGLAGIERWRSVYDSAAQYVMGELLGHTHASEPSGLVALRRRSGTSELPTAPAGGTPAPLRANRSGIRSQPCGTCRRAVPAQDRRMGCCRSVHAPARNQFRQPALAIANAMPA
jgi:hypothetical protein